MDFISLLTEVVGITILAGLLGGFIFYLGRLDVIPPNVFRVPRKYAPLLITPVAIIGVFVALLHNANTEPPRGTPSNDNLVIAATLTPLVTATAIATKTPTPSLPVPIRTATRCNGCTVTVTATNPSPLQAGTVGWIIIHTSRPSVPVSIYVTWQTGSFVPYTNNDSGYLTNANGDYRFRFNVPSGGCANASNDSISFWIIANFPGDIVGSTIKEACTI